MTRSSTDAWIELIRSGDFPEPLMAEMVLQAEEFRIDPVVIDYVLQSHPRTGFYDARAWFNEMRDQLAQETQFKASDKSKTFFGFQFVGRVHGAHLTTYSHGRGLFPEALVVWWVANTEIVGIEWWPWNQTKPWFSKSYSRARGCDHPETDLPGLTALVRATWPYVIKASGGLILDDLKKKPWKTEHPWEKILVEVASE